VRNRRDIFILAGLFAALILFVALGPARQQPAPVERPTTRSSANAGALALYEWLGALGYDARRLEYRAFELAEEDAALFILSPSEPVSAEEARTVLEWVERGGTLIMADDTSAFGASNALLEALEVDVEVYSATTTVDRAAPLQPALDQPPVGAADVRAGRYLAPRRDDYAPLLGTSDALLVAGIRHGRGYVYLSSTARPFSNDGLRDPENAALVLNTLRRVPAGGRVQFDEIHHGYVTPPSTASALSGPWGWAALYAAGTVALYLALTGRRFGRPVPLREESARRSSAEYVESMADLFQRGGKRAYVLGHYRAAFKRRLAKPYGVNPRLDDDELVRALGQAGDVDEPALRALLARLGAPSPAEGELLRVVADADAYLAARAARRP
jgi:hypothetical protein